MPKILAALNYPSTWTQDQLVSQLNTNLNNAPQSLITVMPSGLGVSPARYGAALAGVRVDRTHGSDGLTRSAISAVRAVSRYDGHPIPAPRLAVAGAGSGPPAVVFAVPVALLLAAGVALALRGRRRGVGGAAEGDGR